MKEARFILPYGGPLEAAALNNANAAISNTFGGLTETGGKGYWRDKAGTNYAEPVRVLDVAYEHTDENDAKLYDIAWQYLHEAQQQEVYLRYGNGHVQMITEKSCMDNGHGHFDLSFGGIIEAMNQLTDKGASVEDRLSAFEYLESSLVSKSVAA